eukprot:gb/GFBE01050863.1/.p1 GENE.gb/GFBE01050863.1/~~gb/GFBE01050863.1/.p1  ORF type:complete len:389 (+),score=79.76 gb/GFBE01050863.1/:1-1167(+)
MALARAPAPLSASCSIFVGNVPYDAQEDELKELFSKVGNVTSVRLVLDKDTKTPRGYAFADFADPASVQAAVDKLNHVEYNGRKLRIDAAERELHNPYGGREDGPGPHKGKGGGKGVPPTPIDPAMLPKVDTVADRLARQKEQEAAEKAKMAAAENMERAEIARLMETLTPQQVLHVLGEMQRLTLRAPDVARALVGENQQLALALQHAQFLAGLLEEPPLATEPEVRERARTVREKIWGVSSAPAPAPGMPTAPGAPMAAPMLIPGLPPGVTPLFVPGQASATMMPGTPQAFAPTMMPMGAMSMPSAPVPFGAATAYTAAMPTQMVPSQVPMSAPGVVPGASTEEQRRSLLERLAQLSPAEIDKLPHNTKVQLLEFLQKMPAQQRPA